MGSGTPHRCAVRAQGGPMLSEEQMRELLQQLTEIREHLQKLSLHVVQMFRLVDEVLEKMEGRR